MKPLSPDSLARLPVFPLPETVLFPGTVIPLYVFEPRYCAMIQDAIAEDGSLAVVMLHEDADAMGFKGRFIRLLALEKLSMSNVSKTAVTTFLCMVSSAFVC